MSFRKTGDKVRAEKGKINGKVILYAALLLCVALIDLIAWKSNAFCDFYITYIFPIWINTYGRFTGLFPFSVGEWLIVAGVCLVLATLVFAAIEGIRRICGKRNMTRVARVYFKAFAWILLGVLLIMTLNCTILYHASTFSQKYYGEDTDDYTLEETIAVWNLVAERCNELSALVARDENGDILYPGSTSTGADIVDMQDKAIECMQKLGEQYPQLDGFYPRPKAMFFSDFMCQQYMQGWYFPFTLEANYNDVMYIMNKPSTMCHELAHLRGYIYEDEANFISYLACIRSDDIYFQYSGYLSVMSYLYNDLLKAKQRNPEAFEEARAVIAPVALDRQVFTDDRFVTQEEWDRINRKALLDTKVVGEATDVFLETNLKANGVSDGRISYSRVVRLLLQYYRAEKI